MLNTLTKTAGKKVMDMEIVRKSLPVADISEDAAKDIITHLANVNLYSALNPGKVDDYRIISLNTMVMEGLMRVLYESPELAHKILEKMPATFCASLSRIGDQQKTDIQIVPDSRAFAIIDGVGEAPDKAKEQLLDLLYEKEPEENKHSSEIDLAPSIER